MIRIEIYLITRIEIIYVNLTAMKYAGTVDEYFDCQDHRKEEINKLRAILTETELEETIKWGMPTYTLNGKNIIGIGVFKEWSSLWFHNGALLKDKGSHLVNAQEGKTRALRQWRFRTTEDIDPDLVKAYILEAIENHKNGRRIKFPIKSTPKSEHIEIPDLLISAFEKDAELQNSFNRLSFPRRRDYAIYISEPKRIKTKTSRLKKIIPWIKSGKPLAEIWAKK